MKALSILRQEYLAQLAIITALRKERARAERAEKVAAAEWANGGRYAPVAEATEALRALGVEP